MRISLRFAWMSIVAALAWGSFCSDAGLAAEAAGRDVGAVVAPIAYGTGAKADLRLGVAAATIAELLDAPPLLTERGSQAFISDAFARFESDSATALRARFGALRKRFEARPGHSDATVARDYQAAVVALLHALPPPRDRLFLLGNAAQQAAYNARVLRETAADNELRAAIGRIDAADRTVAGLSAQRAQLAALESNRWPQSAQLAQGIVVGLLGSADAAAFPSAPRIWTIVVRSRRVAGRDAAHLAIAVVWFDGHQDTFAAYPDGDAFDRNTEHMVCRRDREPEGDNLHATPLSPPRGGSYDAMATAFARACDAFTAKAPQYRVSENSDDRFIAAMLTYAGIDPHVVRGG